MATDQQPHATLGLPSTGWRATFSSLRYPSFRLLWTTTVLSAGGNWIQQITLSWLAWEMTESPIKVAVVLGLRTIALLGSPLAGVIADRFDRRKVMMIDHLGLMLIAVAFAGIILAIVSPVFFTMERAPLLLPQLALEQVLLQQLLLAQVPVHQLALPQRAPVR